MKTSIPGITLPYYDILYYKNAFTSLQDCLIKVIILLQMKLQQPRRRRMCMSQLRILETSNQQRRYRLLQFLSHTCVCTMFLQNITIEIFFVFLVPVWCGDNLRAASIEIGMHACTILILYNVHVHAYVYNYSCQPLPHGEISLAAFNSDELHAARFWRRKETCLTVPLASLFKSTVK